MKLEKEIYTTREVALLLQLGPTVIRSEIRNGRLKAQKFGTSYVITREALQDYMEDRKARGL